MLDHLNLPICRTSGNQVYWFYNSCSVGDHKFTSLSFEVQIGWMNYCLFEYHVLFFLQIVRCICVGLLFVPLFHLFLGPTPNSSGVVVLMLFYGYSVVCDLVHVGIFVERVACDWSAAESRLGSLCYSSPWTTHYALQEAPQLSAATGESGPVSYAC